MADQVADRVAAFRTAWSAAGLGSPGEIQTFDAGDRALRDKVDLQLSRDGGAVALGLKARGGGAVVDQPDCPLLSAPLQGWVHDLRADLPPLDRASLRLRVGPDGRRGVWLDAANLDIKSLLEDGAWLRRQTAAVELGQRHKRMVWVEGRARLGEPVLEPWFQTWVRGQPAPLYTTVGGFTQVGWAANRVLVDRVLAGAAGLGASDWVEVGAGAGNLTLPLAGTGARVRAVDIDGLGLAGLARSAAEQSLDGQIEIVRASYQASTTPWLDGAEGVLVDPPRSGLGTGVDALLRHRPRVLLYVSCNAETLIADVARLAAAYGVAQVTSVGLFPHTPLGEWVVGMTRRG